MFKVGDKVLVVDNQLDGSRFHWLKLNSFGKIIGVLRGGLYEVEGVSASHGGYTQQTVRSHHITTKTELPPTNIKSETDSILGSITVTDAKESNVLFMAHLYHGLGMSFRQVAKLTNVHERTVRRRFKKYGIPSRPMNGVK